MCTLYQCHFTQFVNAEQNSLQHDLRSRKAVALQNREQLCKKTQEMPSRNGIVPHLPDSIHQARDLVQNGSSGSTSKQQQQ